VINITFGRGRGLDPISNIIKFSIRVFGVGLSDEIYEMISSYFTFLFLGIELRKFYCSFLLKVF